jgi:beta-galactosidase
MNILTGESVVIKIRYSMQRKSLGGVFFGKSSKFIGYLGILGLLAGGSFTTAAARERVLIDSGWRFQLGDPGDVTTNVTIYQEIGNLAKLAGSDMNAETALQAIRTNPVAMHVGEDVSFVKTNYNDSAWRTLNLPHDWAVELPFTNNTLMPFNSDTNKVLQHGDKPIHDPLFTTNNIGWYRHTFTLPAGDAGKAMWLEFDGIYRNALIWFNGHCIGRSLSGYSSIHFDITPYINPGGTNVLVVRADATRVEGWFYEGAGIYRHVWLVKSDLVHVAHWGTFVSTTSLVGSNATITVQTDVTNQSGSTATGSLTSTIFDVNNNAVTNVTSAISVLSGQHAVVTQVVTMTANLWSLDSPYLYNLVSTVTNLSVAADVYTTPFGVRTVSFDGVTGVLINGKHVEIQGMCNHQDHAGVGMALPDRLQYFRIEKLKQMGVNAYRTSHNPPTPELLDACDRLGMLVLDETRRFGWDSESLGQLDRLIRRDRNHPSVFAWSLANEEWNYQATNAPVILTMQNLAHSLDSTRKCTAAIMGAYNGTGFDTVIDVVGFNYNLGSLTPSYHNTHPYIMGTEVGSTVTTRGIYTNDSTAGYVASYDIANPNATWTSSAETWWSLYYAYPWSSGGFNWTGFDYRGEPTPFYGGWPVINSHFGVMDTCGFPKDLYYYYQANWSPKTVLHVFPHWNWTAGQTINVWAYGNCDTVALFTNGISVGQQTLSVLGHVAWNVPYAAGTLQAIGYRNGQPIITNTVVTTGVPATVALWPDRSTILADGRDVSIVTVAVLDSQGRVVPTATNLVNFTINGGAIIGVGNGNPTSHEADKGSSQRSVFNGFAQVIVQSTNQSGSITLTATATGLTSTNIAITEAASLPAPAVPAGVAAAAGNNQVVVSWDVVPGAITYNLLRATTDGGPYFIIATNSGSLGYADNNVTNLTTYYYVVTANGNGTNSVNSAEVSAMPQNLSAPAAPTGLTAVPGDGQVALSWTGSSGATNYNVKRSTTSGGTYTTVTNTAATSVVNTGLTDGTTYYFEVSALNTSGESANSGWVSAKPLALVSTNLLNNPGFELPATGKISSGYATVPGWTNSGTAYSDTGVQPGGHSGSWEGYGQSSDDGAYQIARNYQIQTGDQFTLTWWSLGEWNGTSSGPYSGTNPNDPFQTVTLLRAAATNTAFSSTVRLALQANGMPGGTWTSYTLTYTAGSADAGKYIGVSFVTSKNSGKTSGTWAAYDDFSLTVTSIPPAPLGLNASAGNAQIVLSWNPVANASGYYVKQSLVSKGSYTYIYTNLTSTTFTNTGLANGTTYYYVVSSFNPAGEGANSTEVSAKPTNVPPVISWVIPTNNSTFIQPKTLTLTASATDADGTVTNVAFFNGTNLLGNVTTGVGNQYSLTWNNAAVGSHTLSACATDNSGATNKSTATIAIVVQPLTLTLPGTQINGQFRLTFQGQNGQNYVLETSTNLADWTPVWTNAPTNGVLMFTNVNATDRSRFYRVSQ